MESNPNMLDFNQLVTTIRQAHDELAQQASRAVNISLTLRNWLIGCYIAEYELNGADRATYGERVLLELADRLSDISNCNRRQLYRYLRFYRLYPKIVGTLPAQFQRLLPASVHPGKVGTASPKSEAQGLPLLERLSYSHLEQLVDIEDDTKRAFYQVECIRGNWSVRELKRQIGSLYYERSGLSHNRQKLAELANQLFVSKYLLELPKQDEMQRFIEEQLHGIDNE